MRLAEHWQNVFSDSDIKKGDYIKIVGPSISGKQDYVGCSAEVIGWNKETNNYEVECKLGYGIFSRTSIQPL